MICCKSCFPNSLTDEGINICFKDEQPENASFPIDVTDKGISICFRDKHWYTKSRYSKINLDVKDSEKNKPIHYIKDQQIKELFRKWITKMIISKRNFLKYNYFPYIVFL